MNKHGMNLFFCVVKCGLTLRIVLFRLSSIPSLLDEVIYEAVDNFVGEVHRYYRPVQPRLDQSQAALPATRRVGKKTQAEEKGSEEERKEEKKEEAMEDEENDLKIEEEKVMEVTFASSLSVHSGP